MERGGRWGARLPGGRVKLNRRSAVGRVVRRGELRVAILAIEGTNCDQELFEAFRSLGCQPEIVFLKQLEGERSPPSLRRRLSDFQILMLPGGFSAGDYVRAGAVLAARIQSRLGDEMADFIRSGKLVGGICNGFQVLVEMGLLPGGVEARPGPPQAALNTNDSAHFECRPTYCRWDGGNFRPFKDHLPAGTVLYIPSAHGEGKLILSGAHGADLRDLLANGQILFRWTDPDGNPAGYPWNPNGSPGDVAGLTSREGTVFGLMPHPERSFQIYHHPDWMRRPVSSDMGDGRRFFEAMVRYAETHL